MLVWLEFLIGPSAASNYFFSLISNIYIYIYKRMLPTINKQFDGIDVLFLHFHLAICCSILNYDLNSLFKPTIYTVGSLVRSGIRVLVYRYYYKFNYIFFFFFGISGVGFTHAQLEPPWINLI